MSRWRQIKNLIFATSTFQVHVLYFRNFMLCRFHFKSLRRVMFAWKIEQMLMFLASDFKLELQKFSMNVLCVYLNVFGCGLKETMLISFLCDLLGAQNKLLHAITTNRAAGLRWLPKPHEWMAPSRHKFTFCKPCLTIRREEVIKNLQYHSFIWKRSFSDTCQHHRSMLLNTQLHSFFFIRTFFIRRWGSNHRKFKKVLRRLLRLNFGKDLTGRG